MGTVKDNGGARKGAGRKSKANELKLAEQIKKAGGPDAEGKLWKKIWKQANDGSYNHQRMISEYLYGKPKETKDLNINNIGLDAAEEYED